MKVGVKLLSMLAMVAMLTGCESEPVIIDTVTDELIVVDLYHREATSSTTFVPAGKGIAPVTRVNEAVYKVEFDYKGIKLKVNDEAIYNKVKDKKYQAVECLLNIEYYDDSNCKIKIIDVK